MELYILDSLYRRVEVVDLFESLIWAERFAAYGDFELSVRSSGQNRTRFKSNVKLAMNESNRVMTVESIEDKTSSDGSSILTVKGRSLEYVMNDRVARQDLRSMSANPAWELTGYPADIVRQIFEDVCVSGILDPADIIPLITSGTMYPASTIPEPSTSVSVKIEPQTVYEAVKQLCDLYGMGFRLTRNYDRSQLFFNVYMGSDRTTQQMIKPAVVFSTDLDNLQNSTALTSVEEYKNVAYVFGMDASAVVYADGVDPLADGFERHVLPVKAPDITGADSPAVQALLEQRGKEELSKHRQYLAFDGEINRDGAYKYGIDYDLGDLIEVRNSDGFTNVMQVTEQIFVSDSEGERSYPTLTLNQFITPGSWLSWDNNRVWQDFGVTEYWSNQP